MNNKKEEVIRTVTTERVFCVKCNKVFCSPVYAFLSGRAFVQSYCRECGKEFYEIFLTNREKNYKFSDKSKNELLQSDKYMEGVIEGERRGRVEELEKVKSELNKRVLESMWDNADRIDLIKEFIEKRLLELQKEVEK